MTVAGTTGNATTPTPNLPPPDDEDTGVMTFKATRNMDMQRFAESSLQEIKIVGTKPRYALNLFGDITLGAGSRSEGARRPDPAFGLGAFDMLFTADLESKITMTTEIAFTYAPNNPIAELERLHLRWKPNKFFFVEAGRFHTDIGYWNVAYHHGRFLQLSIDRPRMIALHGGLVPAHWMGAQAGVSIPLAGGTVSLVGSIGTPHELQGSSGHSAHTAALTSVNGGHAKLEFANILLRDLRFGVSAIYSRIPAETVANRPIVPNQSLDEKIGNAFIAYPSLPFSLIAEAYVIEHTTNSSAPAGTPQYKWRTAGVFAQLGYQIGRFTPYLRGEYIGSEVGAYIFDPFWVPAVMQPDENFAYPMDVKEGIVGTRIDLSDWNSLKLEYQVMGGIGLRNPNASTPLIHTGMVSWSFGI